MVSKKNQGKNNDDHHHKIGQTAFIEMVQMSAFQMTEITIDFSN